MRKGYVNCRIYGNDEATAFIVEENTIEMLGSDEEVRGALAETDEVVDLNGMYVVPGFNDSHMHLLELGYYLSNVQLGGCRSAKDISDRLSNRLSSLKTGDWLIGRGYSEEQFTEAGEVDRALLDTVSDTVPIAITRACGHKMAVNSAALRLAGIEEDTEVEGGHIDYEKGLLEENAVRLMHSAIKDPDVMTLQDYILKGAEYCASRGIISVGSDDFISITKNYKPVLDAFEKLSYQGRLNVRVNEQCEFADPDDFASFLDDGYTFDVGNDFFRIGPLKLITDGSLGARTAALSEPYSDDPSTKGLMVMEEEEIRTYVELANRFNMPTIAHAIGDQAVDHVLNVFEDTLYEGNPLHSGLVHCQILREEQIEKILAMKLSCYYQTGFVDEDANMAEERVGDRIASSYPFRTLFEGTLCSNGSDAPVEMPNPLLGIQLAVTGESRRFPGKRINENQTLSVSEAIDSYTVNGARQFFADDRLGKIEAGYIADFAVLEKNITEIDPYEIADTKVVMTVVEGREVYPK